LRADCNEKRKKSGSFLRKHEISLKKSKSNVISSRNSVEEELYIKQRSFSEDLGYMNTYERTGEVKIAFELFPRLCKINNLENFTMLSKSNSIGFLKSLELIRKDSVILNKIPHMGFENEKE